MVCCQSACVCAPVLDVVLPVLQVPGREHSWLSGLPNLPHLPTAASVKSTLPAHGAAPAKKTIAQMIDEALEESPEPEHVHSAAATADE